MQKYLHNPKIVIGAVAAIFLILIGAGFFFLYNANKSSGPQLDQVQQQTVFPTITQENLGLIFEAKPGNQYVRFTINNAQNITHVSYIISYDAISPDSEGELVSQGLNGDIEQKDIKNDKAGIDWRILGTCSTGGKCRFDQGVKQVHLLLKLTKTDGKIYQAESSLTL